VLDSDGDGAFIILGTSSGADEDLRINLDDTADDIVFTSTTGAATTTFSALDIETEGLQIGSAGVYLNDDADGALTITGFGNGTDEDLTFNFDDTSNEVVVTSSTGVATTTFSGIGLAATYLNVTGTAATSTFANGIRLSGGCFQGVDGTCVGGGGVSGGAANKVAFWTGATTLSNNTLFHWDDSNARLGIGTTSPYAKLSVVGPVVAEYFHATSTSATSTLAGGFNVNNGAIMYDFSANKTSIERLDLGPISFETNAGVVSWIDFPVTSAAATGTKMSYVAQLDSTQMFSIYGESNGIGGVQYPAVAVGATTTPAAFFSIQQASSTSATSTGLLISATDGDYRTMFMDTSNVLQFSRCMDQCYLIFIPQTGSRGHFKRSLVRNSCFNHA
jgi:hypothetical protein